LAIEGCTIADTENFATREEPGRESRDNLYTIPVDGLYLTLK